MIQFADKTYKNYLKPKEKTALDIFYHNGEKDLEKACKQAKYYGQDISRKAQDLLNKPAAKEYIENLRLTQLPDIDIFTEVKRIAQDQSLRPEVRLDGLQLLDKLTQKRTESTRIDDISTIPVSGKDRISWLIEQLMACGTAGKQALALADNDIKSILAVEVKK